MKAQNSVFLAFDDRNVSYSIQASVGVSSEANALYNQHFGQLDEWFLGGRKIFRPNLVFDGRELCPAEKFAESEFYNDFLKRHCEDSFHECGAVLGMSVNKNAPPSLVSFLRTRRQGPFHQRELRILRKLLPHLQRGIQLHRRIVDLRLKNSVQSWALDRVSFGIVLLRADGGVVVANRAAIESCVRARGLELTSVGLHAVGALDEQVLQGMIHAAAFGDDREVAPAIRITSSSLMKSLIVSVIRTRTPDLLAVAPDAIVAVFISDPEKVLVPCEPVLTSVFGLTPAEARLAVLLGKGKTLQDAADHLRVTSATVRTQLLQIFQKTGTSRQSQLISLLSRLPPPQS